MLEFQRVPVVYQDKSFKQYDKGGLLIPRYLRAGENTSGMKSNSSLNTKPIVGRLAACENPLLRQTTVNNQLTTDG